MTSRQYGGILRARASNSATGGQKPVGLSGVVTKAMAVFSSMSPKKSSQGKEKSSRSGVWRNSTPHSRAWS